MADVKISELSELSTAPAVDDMIPISDTSASSTKKIAALTLLGLNAGLDALSDHGYHGITLTGRNYGETVAVGDLVYLDDTAGEWKKAAATDGTGTFPARGVACNANGDGQAAVVMVLGVMRHDAWAFTEGQTLYLSDTGVATGTAPSDSGHCIQVVGFALSDDEAFFNFTGSYSEHT